MHKALVPGSFDPIHNGHLDAIARASSLFDVVIVAAIRNPQKSAELFTLDERQDMIRESVAHLDNVEVGFFSGLVVEFAKLHGCNAIAKGLRAVSDFESELQMAQMNRQLSGIDTVFIPTASRHSFLASRLIREVARYGGDVSGMVPEPVNRRLRSKFSGDAPS